MCDASELQRGESHGFYCNLSSALHDNDLRKQHWAISLSPEHLSDTLAMERPEKHGKKNGILFGTKQLLRFKEKGLFSPPLKTQDECVYFHSRVFLVSNHSL